MNLPFANALTIKTKREGKKELIEITLAGCLLRLTLNKDTIEASYTKPNSKDGGALIIIKRDKQ